MDLKRRGDILFLGEPEYISAATRLLHGIPVEAAALADMNAWSDKLKAGRLAVPTK